MKKILVITSLLCSLSTNAQGVKSFMSDAQINVSFGLSLSECNKRYKEIVLGYGLGVDVQKPIYRFKGDNTIYGLAGLHIEQKGGNKDNSITIGGRNDSSNKKIKATHMKIPVRGGFSHQFPKCSLFFDVGPYFSAKVSDKDVEYVEYAATELGIGFTTGIKYDRFSLSLGADGSLTYFAKYKKYDEEDLKNNTVHLELRWCF